MVSGSLRVLRLLQPVLWRKPLLLCVRQNKAIRA